MPTPAELPEATVLHADLDAFYASVEQRDDPALRGRPVIVGHGVVLAASYEARAAGVRTAMGGRQARALCPAAVVVPPRMDAYSAASREVFAIFEATTPHVEAVSIDEAFLEVGGLRRLAGDPAAIATGLRQRVRDEVGLPISVGIARTKHLAKVASRAAKPDGMLLVPPAEEDAFLHPLPVERLWGVGAITAAKLHDRGVRTVGELAAIEEAALARIVGRAAGHHLLALAQNRDPRPVLPRRRRRSIGAQRASGARSRPMPAAEADLAALVDRVTGRARRAGRVARTVVVRVRFADFGRATRSRTLPEPTNDTTTVLSVARSLLAAVEPQVRERGLTLVGVALQQLDDADQLQLVLPFSPRDRGALDAAVDRVRDRFGGAALTRATLLGRDAGITVPLLPD